MPTVSATDVIRLSVIAEHDGTEDVVNVYDFQPQGVYAMTESAFVDDMRELAEAVVALTKAFSSILTVYRRFRAQIITQADPGRQGELTVATPGTSTGDASAAAVSALFVYRINKPRTVLKKYLGVLTENHINSIGQIESASIAGGVALITAMMSTFTTTAGSYLYGYWDEVPAIFRVPTGGYINAEPAYQRRRRRGYGS